MERLRGKEPPWYEVEISEARRDALRNRLFQSGHPVEKMKRVRIGSLELGALAPGKLRELSAHEANAILRASGKEQGVRKQVSATSARRGE